MSAQYNLLYYVYAPLGESGRARAVAALLGAPLPPSLTGRVRVGLDGLNASLSGPRTALETHAAFVSALPELCGAPPIDFKYAPLRAAERRLAEEKREGERRARRRTRRSRARGSRRSSCRRSRRS